MSTKMTAALLLAALLPWTAIGASALPPSTRNPDRWPTLDASEFGSSSFKGEQITYGAAGGQAETALRNLSVTTPVTFLVPVNDQWSVLLGAGTSWTEQDIVSNAPAGTSASSNSQGTASFSVRRYFEDRNEMLSRHGDNPDQWPSLALTGNGASTFHYSNADNNGDKGIAFKSNNFNLALDGRLPVADAWTLTANAGGGRAYSRSDPLGAANGVRSVNTSVTAGAGFRYYLVGVDLIKDDDGSNPDRWVMLALSGSATLPLRSRQTVATLGGLQGQRDTSTRAYTATLTTRVPITRHMSLHFDLSSTYNRVFSAILAGVPTQAGVLSRTSSVGFQAGLRYFFF